MSGPLSGLRVVELAGLGPAPYACMLLADAGADIVRLDRPGSAPGAGAPTGDLLSRGRPTVGIDLKAPGAAELVLDLAERADVLVEGFRPGVTERLGIGPDACWARNRRLVYGRMTGWGQEGPLSGAAGHDIDYIAVSGALWPIGRPGEPPVPPLNLVGDFGGGGMFLAFGVLAAVYEAERSGQGQVVDAAMVDGAASLLTMVHGFAAAGLWRQQRGANLLDSAAPFYDVYETADGGWFAVGAIEPKFYAALLRGLGLEDEELPSQMDRAAWPALKERFAAIFRTRTRSEWTAVFEGSDACAAPVLSPWEAPTHPHLAARGTFVEVDGVVQPGAAPRFGRTPGAAGSTAQPEGGGDAALARWGLATARIGSLRRQGVLG